MKTIYMKTLCAFLFFIPYLTFSQTTVSIISGFSNAQAFTAVEPGTGFSTLVPYRANVIDFPSGGTYEWSVNNGTIQLGVNYQQDVNQ
jgi:hypothetical protein